jgi:hypothetical protein
MTQSIYQSSTVAPSHHLAFAFMRYDNKSTRQQYATTTQDILDETRTMLGVGITNRTIIVHSFL